MIIAHVTRHSLVSINNGEIAWNKKKRITSMVQCSRARFIQIFWAHVIVRAPASSISDWMRTAYWIIRMCFERLCWMIAMTNVMMPFTAINDDSAPLLRARACVCVCMIVVGNLWLRRYRAIAVMRLYVCEELSSERRLPETYSTLVELNQKPYF